MKRTMIIAMIAAAMAMPAMAHDRAESKAPVVKESMTPRPHDDGRAIASNKFGGDKHAGAPAPKAKSHVHKPGRHNVCTICGARLDKPAPKPAPAPAPRR